MTPFAGTILAPAIQSFANEFKQHDLTKSSLAVSIYMLGYGVGSLFFSPLSEIYGRFVVLNGSNAFFCVWLFACDLAPNLETLIFFRFMAGFGGSGSQTIGGAIIADMFPVQERGRALTIWLLGNLYGPCSAIIGSYVSQSIGWRWVHWICLFPAAFLTLAVYVVGRETHYQLLMNRKVQKLRRELGRPKLRSCYADEKLLAMGTIHYMLISLIRPIRILFTSITVLSLSTYIAFMYGCLYLLFNTIPIVFQEQYRWPVGPTGLIYLTILIGYTIGVVISYMLSDSSIIRATAANKGVYQPEMRLSNCIWFAAIMPITFFWYGWAAAKQLHWIIPVIGIVPFGIGIVGVWQPIQTYIIDSNSEYAASGLAVFCVLRNVGAAFLPLVSPRMYESLGIGWGTSLLGFIAIALIPIPTLIYRYGAQLRRRYPLNL